MAYEMQISYFSGSFFGALGVLIILIAVWRVAAFISIYLKPSKLDRYLHRKDGKQPWALVTGSTVGIGTQYASQLASRGFNVVLHGRNPEKLRRVLAELQRLYPERSFRTWVADAIEYGSGQRPFDELVDLVQDLNLTVLVNNAGGTNAAFTTLEHFSRDEIVNITLVNSLFPTLLTAALLPILVRSTPSLIINLSSAADFGIPLLGSYPASKGYVKVFNAMLRREMVYEERDVEVLCVKYGPITGTGSNTQAPSLFAPEAPVIVKASLDRVGCGRDFVAPYWPQALMFAVLGSLPGFLQDYVLVKSMRQGISDPKWRSKDA